MNNANDAPVKSLDPFANIDLDEFKAQETAKPARKRIDEKLIRQAAEETNFKSREPVAKKERVITKTYSLFPADIGIINDVIKLIPSSIDMGQPSGSDVVRAALFAFGGLDKEQQISLVQKFRGRSRR